MKKYFVLAAFAVLAVSCNKKEENPSADSNVMLEESTTNSASTNSSTNTSTNASTSTSAEPEGKKLIAGMDCLSCHKEDAKLVGPAFQDVAGKYTEADVDKLADKIIAGGKGNWGEVPMTPHPDLPKDNAKKMVEYILTLKK